MSSVVTQIQQWQFLGETFFKDFFKDTVIHKDCSCVKPHEDHGMLLIFLKSFTKNVDLQTSQF